MKPALNRVPSGSKEEQTSKNPDKPHKHYARSRKWDTKGYISHHFRKIHFKKVQERHNYRVRKQIHGFLGLAAGTGVGYKQGPGHF
jgi:hypothetical protein